MRSLRLLVFTLIACAATASGLSAQARFEITPFAGAFLPLTDLTDAFGTDRVVQSHASAVAFGAHAGVRSGALSFEGTFAYVGTSLDSEGSNVTIAEDQTILMFGGSVLYNIEMSRFMEFFFAGGLGLKSYSADDPLSPPGFEAGSSIMYNAGGGLRHFISPTMAIRLDLRDYMSSFDAFELTPASDLGAKMQHDLLLTVGLSFVLGGT
jgi:hypothetical protein